MFISIDIVGVMGLSYHYITQLQHLQKVYPGNALSGNWIHSIQRFVNNIFDLVLEFKIFFTILL